MKKPISLSGEIFVIAAIVVFVVAISGAVLKPLASSFVDMRAEQIQQTYQTDRTYHTNQTDQINQNDQIYPTCTTGVTLVTIDVGNNLSSDDVSAFMVKPNDGCNLPVQHCISIKHGMWGFSGGLSCTNVTKSND